MRNQEVKRKTIVMNVNCLCINKNSEEIINQTVVIYERTKDLKRMLKLVQAELPAYLDVYQIKGYTIEEHYYVMPLGDFCKEAKKIY